MKIIIIEDHFPPENIGGAGKVAFQIAQALQRLGHDIFIITTTSDKNKVGNHIYENLHVFNIYACSREIWRSYTSLYSPRIVREVKKIVNQLRADVIHFHNIHHCLSYGCFKMAKKSGAKVFLTAHDTMLFHYGKFFECINANNLSIPSNLNYKVTTWQLFKRFKIKYNPLRNIIIRHSLKYIDKIFVVSRTLQKALDANKIKNTEVIYNGINVNDWLISSSDTEQFKKRLNLNDKKIILFVGRLGGLKGGEQALRAMTVIVKKVPNAILLVVGSVNTRTEGMLQMAKQLGVENNIVFTGWLNADTIKLAYDASDTVITPSVYLDAFNLTNIEAMAAKRPVVGTCFGGTAEIIQEGITGYIINPHNADQMAEKITFLLENKKTAELMGQAGYELVKKKFSQEEQIEKILSWYEGVKKI